MKPEALDCKTITLACLYWVVSVNPCAWAQSKEEVLGAVIPKYEENSSEAEKAMGKEYRRFTERLKASHNPPEGEEEGHDQPVADTTPTTKNYYIIKGNEGIPFPDPHSIRDEDMFPPTPTPEPTPTPLPTATPWQKPRRCEADQTRVEVHTPESNSHDINYEILFVYKDFIPLDSIEVYGAKVGVHGYDPLDGKGTEVRMEIYQVPCIPYRIRRTNHAYYYDTGLNALKNYDGDQTGKGKIHPWIAQKVFGAQTKKPQRTKRLRSR